MLASVKCNSLWPHGPYEGSLPGSSVQGTFQARILEWVAMPSSRESSRPKDRTRVSCISCVCRWIPYCWVTGEAHPLEWEMATHSSILAGSFPRQNEEQGEGRGQKDNLVPAGKLNSEDCTGQSRCWEGPICTQHWAKHFTQMISSAPLRTQWGRINRKNEETEARLRTSFQVTGFTADTVGF